MINPLASTNTEDALLFCSMHHLLKTPHNRSVQLDDTPGRSQII